MDRGDEPIVYVRKTRVARVDDDDDTGPTIAFGLEGLRGEQWFFVMADASAYDFIRRMKQVLFDVDPPRSGAGSPGAEATPP
jgi:hypothetical protein